MEFALAVARAGLDLRPALVDCYRALRDGDEGTDALAAALRGSGTHPRTPAVCGRLLRILVELKLVSYRQGSEGAGWRLLEAAPTALEQSRAHRAYAERLRVVEARLHDSLGAAARAATA